MADYELSEKETDKKKTKEQKHTHLDERIFNEAPHANATWTRRALSVPKHANFQKGLAQF